jgi:hypothetical protein
LVVDGMATACFRRHVLGVLGMQTSTVSISVTHVGRRWKQVDVPSIYQQLLGVMAQHTQCLSWGGVRFTWGGSMIVSLVGMRQQLGLKEHMLGAW